MESASQVTITSFFKKLPAKRKRGKNKRGGGRPRVLEPPAVAPEAAPPPKKKKKKKANAKRKPKGHWADSALSSRWLAALRDLPTE